MADFLLDTSTVSLLLRGNAPVRDRMAAHRREELSISVITALELHFGLAWNPGVRIRPMVEELLATLRIEPLAADVGPVYARVRERLQRAGTPIGPLDALIAAHAVALGRTVVTNNVDEFRRVAGLSVEDWAC